MELSILAHDLYHKTDLSIGHRNVDVWISILSQCLKPTTIHFLPPFRQLKRGVNTELTGYHLLSSYSKLVSKQSPVHTKDNTQSNIIIQFGLWFLTKWWTQVQYLLSFSPIFSFSQPLGEICGSLAAKCSTMYTCYLPTICLLVLRRCVQCF